MYVKEESEHNPSSTVDSDDNQWTIEIERAVKYLVKWLGYPDNENSWEKKKNIDPDIVAIFETDLLLSQN